MSIYSLFDFSFLVKLQMLGNCEIGSRSHFAIRFSFFLESAHWARLNKIQFPSGFNLMSFDNNIDTMLSEIQWNFIVKIAFNFFTQCRIMDWIYYFPSLFGSNRIEIEKCDQFCKSVTMYSRI